MPGLTSLDVVARGLYPDNPRYSPSPRATDGEKGGPNQRGSKGDLMLPSAAAQWATPGTDSFRSRGGDRKDEMGLDQQARHWATPTQSDGMGGPGCSGRDGGDNLRPQVVADAWRTPSAYDGQQRHNRVGTMNRIEAGKTISLGMQMTTVEKSGQLNPAWVSQLQGLPDGWLDLSREVPEAERTRAVVSPRWPAGPSCEQYEWEAPRVASGIKDRAKQLKALGNGNPPAQYFAVFAAIMDAEAQG